MTDNAITMFRGPWVKFSNYSLVSIWYDGHIYASVEHAYQAAKFLDFDREQYIRNLPTPNMAKKEASRLAKYIRSDWHDVKITVMRTLLREKFQQEPERTLLLASENCRLVEGNWWHDNFWGNCTCYHCAEIPGQNHLGELLMQIRDEIRRC